MFLAIIDTSAAEFYGTGATAQHAENNVRAAVAEHGRQVGHGQAPGAGIPDDVVVIDLSASTMWRDREPIVSTALVNHGVTDDSGATTCGLSRTVARTVTGAVTCPDCRDLLNGGAA